MPQVLYDGDFTTAQVAGPPEFEIPFAIDPKPYVYTLTYWQFLNSFVDIPFGEPGPLGGTYVGGAVGSFKGVGGGVVEFKRTFANVPDTRSEYESFIYNQSVYFPCTGSLSGVAEIPLTRPTRIQFDYFQTDDPQNDIELPKAPVMWAPGAVFFLNGFLDIACAPTGTEVLAEDSSFKTWRGNIYERRMRFVAWTEPLDVIQV